MKYWPKDLKPFKVGDIIGTTNTTETTKIVKVNGWRFWTENNWVGGGSLLEGRNWEVFHLAKRQSFLKRLLNRFR